MKDFKFKLEPWAHQREGVERQIPFPNYGYWYEVGAGKSKVTIDSMRYRYGKAGKLMRTLVLCPPIVIKNWADEIVKNSNISRHSIVLVQGTGKKRLKMLQDIGDKDRIIVTNYETLSMGAIFDWLVNYSFDIVVADEAHYLKNSSAKRSKATYRLGDLAKYRYALSGTPILNTPMDVFGIYRFLDKGESFGSNVFGFRHKFFYDANANMPSQRHFPNWKPRESMMDELSEKMGKISHHVKKIDCLDLPPLVKKTLEVEMSTEQKRLYKDMKKDLIAFIEKGDKAAVAQLALTKALRLQQIVSGFIRVEDKNGTQSDFIIKDNPRAKALEELLSKITPNHKVIIWAIFKQNYKTIAEVCAKLGIEYVEVHGGVTAKKKDENVYKFNNDDNVRVFIGHPSSGGIGINLVVSDYTIYYSRSFSLGDDIQSEARNYRGGSERHSKVTRIDLVAPDTIDILISQRLQGKQAISDKILIDMIKD